MEVISRRFSQQNACKRRLQSHHTKAGHHLGTHRCPDEAGHFSLKRCNPIPSSPVPTYACSGVADADSDADFVLNQDKRDSNCITDDRPFTIGQSDACQPDLSDDTAIPSDWLFVLFYCDTFFHRPLLLPCLDQTVGFVRRSRLKQKRLPVPNVCRYESIIKWGQGQQGLQRVKRIRLHRVSLQRRCTVQP